MSAGEKEGKVGDAITITWRIEPGLPAPRGDVIAGVSLPNGKLMALNEKMEGLEEFKSVGETARVARDVPFDKAQEGIVQLDLNQHLGQGTCTIVAAVLSPGSNRIQQVILSNQFEKR